MSVFVETCISNFSSISDDDVDDDVDDDDDDDRTVFSLAG